jgi:hypothetical protein
MDGDSVWTSVRFFLYLIGGIVALGLMFMAVA